ncbi:DUF3301 domain-containing protein [Pseudomonas citronellolis]|uniref:DUF3301 domain-containing protein n=1 Tax=Pseudomonas citronellolis TaxID=53408 RepID=UPI0023E40316|nr:DUF3301 domain-containing protein [Pseudomonas citronellolis]MDF3933444.1 DUF3301 domain-containing protein [Pseudomonas citronellolis]
MLLATAAAWWWRAHGIRERALQLARQHCSRQGVELLDEAVALRRLRLRRGANGLLCLAREYAFEFTATGEDRYAGSITMLGQRPGPVELEPFRFHPEPHEVRAVIEIAQALPAPQAEPAAPRHKAEVVHLAEWRRNHADKKVGD